MCEVASLEVDSLEVDVSALICDSTTPGSLISFRPMHRTQEVPVVWRKSGNGNKPGEDLKQLAGGRGGRENHLQCLKALPPPRRGGSILFHIHPDC